MKVFISYAPQQPEGKLMLNSYAPQGNALLKYKQTRFPIMPVINAYADPGEKIHVVLVVEEKESCKYNAALFEEELKALCTEKQLDYGEIDVISAPYDDTVDTHIGIFQQMIDRIGDNDEIHACMTYGSKPSPMVELMAIRYAKKIKKNVFIACVVYGGMDHVANTAKIYDETALAQLDDIVSVLASAKVGDPAEKLRNILAL